MRRLMLCLIVAVTAVSAYSQNKILTFNQFQSRANSQEWEMSKSTAQRSARFSSGRIDLRLERNYRLNIVTSTHLPENGIIYLCKDEQQNDVTVMLLADKKMFVYDDQKRFKVDFHSPMEIKPAIASRN